MSTQSYTTTFTVDRTPAEVFAAVNDVRSWWGKDVQGDVDEVGAEFVFEVEGVHYSKICVTELVPGEKVVWEVIDARLTFVEDTKEWDDTEIRFEIAEQGDATEVRFTHVGLRPEVECYDACSNAWAFYVGDSLRSLIATGEGKPSGNPTDAEFQERQLSA
jgi:uncharacterized protein YndB with AHSA1/START domain